MYNILIFIYWKFIFWLIWEIFYTIDLHFSCETTYVLNNILCLWKIWSPEMHFDCEVLPHITSSRTHVSKLMSALSFTRHIPHSPWLYHLWVSKWTQFTLIIFIFIQMHEWVQTHCPCFTLFRKIIIAWVKLSQGKNPYSSYLHHHPGS